jgi:hypothetical protein
MKATTALLLGISIAACAKDKPEDPRLQAIKVVYVDGRDTEALEV